MKKFILKIAIFAIPIIAYYIFPVSVIFLSKEYYTAAQVVETQNANKQNLYGNVYNTGSYIPYKEDLIQTNNPNIVAIGSSRAMEIRKEFFNASTTFINAGLAGRSLEAVEYFLNTMPNTLINGKNRILLFVVDREMFTRDPSAQDARTDDYASILGLHLYLPLNVARGMYLDYFARHKYNFTDLLHNIQNNNAIGINAIAFNEGFRSDGSFKYNRESKDPALLANNTAAIHLVTQDLLDANPSSLLVSDDQKIAINLKTLQQLLALARSRDITVIGFIPPYPTEINQATFNPISPYAKRETNLTNKIIAEFEQASSSFYDLSDISKYGGTDSEFVDTVHGDDLMYAKVSLYLAEHNQLLANYFDKKALQKMIASTTGNFLPF